MTFMTYCERASKTFKNGLLYSTVYSKSDFKHGVDYGYDHDILII